MFAASKTAGVSGAVNYIEDVFSTWLYTGNGATQTITNGIDLAGKGGLVWAKTRSNSSYHGLSGPNFATSYFGGYGGLRSNQTAALGGTDFAGVSSTGFNLAYIGGDMNFSGWTYASWTFRKQPKFFDVVTYTGTGANTTIAHSLGSVPGCIIVKRTDTTADWAVYHRSLANTQYLVLNSTASAATGATWWNSTTPTSSVFSVGTDASVNASGGTYVAYIYAHDAGGFGLTGTDNVISCGSFTTSGTGGSATVNLGYEPQWVFVKPSSVATTSGLVDSIRGNAVLNGTNNTEQYLSAESSAAEASSYGYANPTATGFVAAGWGSTYTFVYIAIRRGPMKVPTVGTSVFSPVARTGTDVNTVISGIGFATDLLIGKYRGYTNGPYAFDRLRGTSVQVRLSDVTGAEASGYDAMVSFNNTSVTVGVDTYALNTNNSISNLVNYFFGRAPSFFDIVCDTGTGVAHTVSHNLGIAPELILRKSRSTGNSWNVYYGSAGNFLQLDLTSASAASATIWDNTVPTSSVFSVGGSSAGGSNFSGTTYLSYLFATCPGVSKVGTYTGNGTTQTIDCGFTGGARFVLIKKTSATGDWYVYDTARGMTTLTDPYVLFNSTAVEAATLGSVTTVSTGFALNSAILAAINTNAASYVFLAIA
jgi:hypothetical protein